MLVQTSLCCVFPVTIASFREHRLYSPNLWHAKQNAVSALTPVLYHRARHEHFWPLKGRETSSKWSVRACPHLKDHCDHDLGFGRARCSWDWRCYCHAPAPLGGTCASVLLPLLSCCSAKFPCIHCLCRAIRFLWYQFPNVNGRWSVSCGTTHASLATSRDVS